MLLVAVHQRIDHGLFGTVRIASVDREDFVRRFGRAIGRAIELCCVVEGAAGRRQVDAVVSAAETLIDVGSGASAALAGAPRTFVSLLVGVVVLRALVFALLAALVLDAFLAHLFVESVAVALFTARMALATNGFAGQRLQRPLFLRSDPFVVVAVWTRFRLFQASILII